MFLPPCWEPTKSELTAEAPGAFTADAYDNEMGVRLLPDIDDEVLAPSVSGRG